MSEQPKADPRPLWLMNEEPDPEALALAQAIREGDALLAELEKEKLASVAQFSI
jgi:hypothetical protein